MAYILFYYGILFCVAVFFIQSSDLICNGTVVFDSNKAETFGGGFSAYFGSYVSFNGSTAFTANSAYQGGGMNMQGCNLICNGNIVNRAENGGGGISALATSLEFYGNTSLMGNSAFQLNPRVVGWT